MKGDSDWTIRVRVHTCTRIGSIPSLQMDHVVIMANPSPRYRPHSSFAKSDQSNDSDDEQNMMKEIEEHFGKSKVDDHESQSTMNSSMAWNDLTIPLKDGSKPTKKRHSNSYSKRASCPVRSILRNGSILEGEETQRRQYQQASSSSSASASPCKRLSFALSPTFISEPKLRRSSYETITNESMHSLDGDDLYLFAEEQQQQHEPNTSLHSIQLQEASLKMGDMCMGDQDERTSKSSRRISMNEFKAKSSQRFDERNVGRTELGMGSFDSNASWSSI